ncbi:MAG TPA: PLP-dependent aminotransferase family protein, partial [Burkholderiaceae bacterium]|nr:PLP-dependent aminotransferase family protein [Burkholderiaceae bacterium]
RALLIDALAPALGKSAWISSQSAGLHLVIRLPDQCNDQLLAELAATKGVRVSALSSYYVGASHTAGLVVGYGYAPSAAVERCGRTLAHLLRASL